MSKFLFFFFSLFSTIFLYDADSVYFSDKVYITSLLIQYFSLYYIFSNDKRPYSLNKIFYLFCFFFFGVAPLIQSTDNISLWGGGYFNENDYFVMNILILVILISYQLFYTKFSNFKINIKSLRILNEYKLQELSFI